MSWFSNKMKKLSKWVSKQDMNDEIQYAIEKVKAKIHLEVADELPRLEEKGATWIVKVLREAGHDVPRSVVKRAVAGFISEIKTAILKRI